MSLTFPFDAKLKDSSLVQLVPAGERDVEPQRRLIVEEGGPTRTKQRDQTVLFYTDVLGETHDE
jgi:hypothetical protein